MCLATIKFTKIRKKRRKRFLNKSANQQQKVESFNSIIKLRFDVQIA